MQIQELPWQVCIRKRTNDNTIIDDCENPFIVVPNPSNGWAADPFIIETESNVYIFAELYSYNNWKGSIGYCTYYEKEFSEWKRVISGKKHYSFPNIWKGDSAYYMMPECYESGKIPLFIATDFPNKWEEIEPLFEGGKYVDSIFMPDGKLLSYNIINGEYTLEIPGSDIRIMDCEKLLRPGGKFFQHNGEWYRPAQDSKYVYGGALNINKLCSGNGKQIIEECKKHVGPTDVNIIGLPHGISLRALHTYNCSEHYEVIDVQYIRFNLLYLFKRTFSKFHEKRKQQKK